MSRKKKEEEHKNCHLTFPSYISYFFKIRQTPIFRFHGSRHLVRHLVLQSTPLDAHRKMSMSHFKIRLNYGTRAELCPKPFENLTFHGNMWIPKIKILLISSFVIFGKSHFLKKLQYMFKMMIPPW